MRFLTSSIRNNTDGQKPILIQALLKACMTKFETRRNDTVARSQLSDLCDFILLETRRPTQQYGYRRIAYSLPDAVLAPVVEALANLGRFDSLISALNCMTGQVPLSTLRTICRVLNTSNKNAILPA